MEEALFVLQWIMRAVYGRADSLDRTGLGYGFDDRTKESMTDYIEGARIRR